MAETWNVSKLDVDVAFLESIPVVKASGECDLITSRKLKEITDNLINTGHTRIAFDLRGMTYIDSSGFRVLIEAKKKVSQRDGNIVLVSLTTPVQRVYSLLNLDQLITRTDTLEQAVQVLTA